MESSKKSNDLTKRYDKIVKIFIFNNTLIKLQNFTESLKTQSKTNGDK